MTVYGSVQLPPDSTGKLLLHRKETIAAVDNYIQQVDLYGLDTYLSQINVAALQTANNQVALYNVAASGFDVWMLSCVMINASPAGHAGIPFFAVLGKAGSIPTGGRADLYPLNVRGTTVGQASVGFINTPTSAPGSSNLFWMSGHSGSFEQAGGSGGSSQFGRNVLPDPRMGRPWILHAGETAIISLSSADAGGLIGFQFVVGICPT